MRSPGLAMLFPRAARPLACAAVFSVLLPVVRAADTRPVVGPGATREEVLEAYGWPDGHSQLGGREVLTYPQGQITLQNGVVEKVEFSTAVEWAKPKPRPAPVTATKPMPAATPTSIAEAWLAHYPEALERAKASGADVLVLFTGSDWSPPAKRFDAEVASNATFLSAVKDHYVLLRLDFPTHAALASDLREQNAALRERFGVTSYPTLLIASSAGDELARVNLAKPRSEPTYAEQVLAAIAEARPEPQTVVKWLPAGTAAVPVSAEATGASRPSLTLRWVAAIVGIGVLAAAIGWWLGRRREDEPGPSPDALPTPADLASWPVERIREVAAALFEFEGSRVQVRSPQTGADLALFSGDASRPTVLVRCQAASIGLAAAQPVRDLFATRVTEGAEHVWYLAVGGFTAEARAFAVQRGVVLIGGEEFLQRLKALPPIALLRVVNAQR